MFLGFSQPFHTSSQNLKEPWHQFLIVVSLSIGVCIVAPKTTGWNLLNFKNDDIFHSIDEIKIPRVTVHPGLTIRFHLFEIKRVLVYNSTIFKFTDLFILYFLFKMYMPTKKYLRKKGWNIMYNGSNCNRKPKLSDILTEPLNPRSSWEKSCHKYFYRPVIWTCISGVTTVGGKIYIIGGFTDQDMLDRGTSGVDVYDLETGDWFKETPFPQTTWEHSLTSLLVPWNRI